ncbi:unnamed protein product, partial [Hapterophycus canaliculatus]
CDLVACFICLVCFTPKGRGSSTRTSPQVHSFLSTVFASPPQLSFLQEEKSTPSILSLAVLSAQVERCRWPAVARLRRGAVRMSIRIPQLGGIHSGVRYSIKFIVLCRYLDSSRTCAGVTECSFFIARIFRFGWCPGFDPRP